MGLRRFGAFEADLDAFALHRGGQRVPLQRQPFMLLARLLETPGQIVSRAELRRRLWTQGVHVGFEHGLDSALHRLRRALDDPARASQVLETLPGIGVRLVARVARPVESPRTDLSRAAWLRERRTPRALRAATALYRAASEAAPEEPAPHGGLARTLVLLAEYGLGPAGLCWEGARRAATRALGLDAHDADAAAALAAVRHRCDRRPIEAEAAYRAAIRRNASDVASRQGLAELLSQQGRHAEALAEIRTARGVDAVSPVLCAVEAWLLFHARRPADAVGCAREVLALDAGFPIARLVLGRALLQAGRTHEALHHLRRAAEDAPAEACVIGSLAYAEARCGQAASARRRIAGLDRLPSAAYFHAKVLAALGDTRAAWSSLRTAVAARAGWIGDLDVDPEWDPWREEPGLQALLRSLATSNAPRPGSAPARGPRGLLPDAAHPVAGSSVHR
jgi:DNA-binding winged helix-turn-helix (wHTH) protein